MASSTTSFHTTSTTINLRDFANAIQGDDKASVAAVLSNCHQDLCLTPGEDLYPSRFRSEIDGQALLYIRYHTLLKQILQKPWVSHSLRIQVTTHRIWTQMSLATLYAPETGGGPRAHSRSSSHMGKTTLSYQKCVHTVMDSCRTLAEITRSDGREACTATLKLFDAINRHLTKGLPLSLLPKTIPAIPLDNKRAIPTPPSEDALRRHLFECVKYAADKWHHSLMLYLLAEFYLQTNSPFTNISEGISLLTPLAEIGDQKAITLLTNHNIPVPRPTLSSSMEVQTLLFFAEILFVSDPGTETPYLEAAFKKDRLLTLHLIYQTDSLQFRSAALSYLGKKPRHLLLEELSTLEDIVQTADALKYLELQTFRYFNGTAAFTLGLHYLAQGDQQESLYVFTFGGDYVRETPNPLCSYFASLLYLMQSDENPSLLPIAYYWADTANNLCSRNEPYYPKIDALLSALKEEMGRASPPALEVGLFYKGQYETSPPEKQASSLALAVRNLKAEITDGKPPTRDLSGGRDLLEDFMMHDSSDGNSNTPLDSMIEHSDSPSFNVSTDSAASLKDALPERKRSALSALKELLAGNQDVVRGLLTQS